MKKLIILVVIIISILLIGGWFLSTKKPENNQPQTITNQKVEDSNLAKSKEEKINTNANPANLSTPPTDWQTYISPNYGYKISIPKGWYWQSFNDPITVFYASAEDCLLDGSCFSSSALFVILKVADESCNSAEECADKKPYSATCAESSDRKTTTIDQFPAIEQIEYTPEGCSAGRAYGKLVYWVKDNKLYTLQGLTHYKEEFNKSAETFEEIKKSIRF